MDGQDVNREEDQTSDPTSDQTSEPTPDQTEDLPTEPDEPVADTPAAEAEADPAPLPPPEPDREPKTEKAEGPGEEFAQMLEASEAVQGAQPAVGDKITGTVVQIGEAECFVDCGARSELPIATKELLDEDGNLTVKEGDQITAHVQQDGEGLGLTLGLDLRHAGLASLEKAFADRTPLTGTVRQTNKGGFTVDLGGFRAFCPYSQIDVRRIHDAESFVGRELKFRILELADGGRNIVISRRAILQEEREEIAAQTRDSLTLGDVLEGTVTRLAPFGAFVDIGGVEGLVHISQISYRRIQDAADVLKEGDQVKVKVLEIQNLGQGRQERISLSMKALAEDPWPAAAGDLQVGSEVDGKVTRLTDFGAFVELLPGIEGLIHISEMANRRIIHPREILMEDQEVPVRILDVDLDRRRISLSLKQSTRWEGD